MTDPIKPKFKTVHENNVLINPPQKCKNENQCLCDGSCKEKENYIILKDENFPLMLPKQQTFSDVFNSIIELVKNTPNDQELGGEIRRLFSAKNN